MTSRYKPQQFCCWSQYEVEGFANGWHKAVSTILSYAAAVWDALWVLWQR